MGQVKVAKRMAKDKIVRDLNGGIIDWYDQEHGGWIVRKGEIINQRVWDMFVKKEEDRKEAAKAPSLEATADAKVVEERKNIPSPNALPTPHAPSQIEEIENRFNQKFDDLKKDVDSKFDQIINALKK
jgi:hypothetical protein